MIGLQIFLICAGIAVLAAIPLTNRLTREYLAENRRLKEVLTEIRRLWRSLGEIERELARIAAEEAESGPESPDSREIGVLGTQMSDFEPPEAAIDPYDGLVPYLDTTWRSPVPPDEGDDLGELTS